MIDERIAAQLKARFVVEGANMPTTPAAQQVLHDRGVTVAPDFVANAGAVIAAGVAMDARHSTLRPAAGPIYELVTQKLRGNIVSVPTRPSAKAPRRTPRRSRSHRAVSARRCA